MMDWLFNGLDLRGKSSLVVVEAPAICHLGQGNEENTGNNNGSA